MQTELPHFHADTRQPKFRFRVYGHIRGYLARNCNLLANNVIDWRSMTRLPPYCHLDP